MRTRTEKGYGPRCLTGITIISISSAKRCEHPSLKGARTSSPRRVPTKASGFASGPRPCFSWSYFPWPYFSLLASPGRSSAYLDPASLGSRHIWALPVWVLPVVVLGMSSRDDRAHMAESAWILVYEAFHVGDNFVELCFAVLLLHQTLCGQHLAEAFLLGRVKGREFLSH